VPSIVLYHIIILHCTVQNENEYLSYTETRSVWIEAAYSMGSWRIFTIFSSKEV